MRTSLVWLCVLALGCNQEPPPVAENDVATEVTPEPPKESKKLRAFKEKAAVYIDEARAGAKLLTLAPSLKEVSTKATQITDLFTHLPDVPTEIDATEETASKLHRINGQFALAEGYVKTIIDAKKLGTDGDYPIAVSNIELAKIIKTVKQLADELETKIGE